MKNKTTTLLIAILAALLTSCSMPQVHSWMDPQFEGREIGKTMVLGIGESDSRSRQYEALFVNSLTERGVTAHSLHALVQKTDPISKESLDAALIEHNYNSILVTRKCSETERNQVVTTDYHTNFQDDYYGYYSYGYSLSFDTATVQSFMEFELETNLYDVKTQQLIWTGRKVVYDNRSDLSNMKSIVKGIMKDLRKKDLL